MTELATLSASLFNMGLSQLDCLCEALSSGHGIAYSAHQRSPTIPYLLSSGTCSLSSMADWRTRVPAAEAKKAGNASEVTRRMPKPPTLTGRDAWAHLLSDNDRFRITSRPVRSKESNSFSLGWSTQGAVYVRASGG